MKYVMKRLIALIITVTVVIISIVPVYAQMTDVNGHWAAEQITKWAERGIIEGNPDGTFAPEKSITRAEFSSIICRIFGYTDKAESMFADVKDNAWYYDEVSKASAAGVIKGDGIKFRPNDTITRQEAAVIISRAFMTETKNVNVANKYKDKSSIASWALDAVNALTSNGYMSGRGNESFAPTAGITRAETVKIIDNILSDIKNEKGTYTGNVEKSLLVNADGVILKDMVIKGDLILAQGIAEGNVTLDNVKVEGRTIVLGGGENSIHFVNTSLAKLFVIKSNGKVRIVAEGTTDIASVAVQSGAKLEESDLKGTGFNKVEAMALVPGQQLTLDGDFSEVIISAPNAEVKVLDGTVGTVSVTEKAAGTKIDIAEAAKVTTLDAGAGLSVTGKGTIENANINSDGVVIEKEPTKVTLASGITANVGGKDVKGNESPVVSGGGSYTPGTSETTFSMSLTKVGGGSIPATRSGSTYTFDLTSENVNDSDSINGLKIESTPVASSLKFVDMNETITGTNGSFRFSGNNSLIDAYFGAGFIFDGDVSVQTIKSILSGTITREAVIMIGSSEKNVKINVKISDSGDVLGDEDLFDCFTIKSTTPGAITATAKSGKESTRILSGKGFYTSLKNMITIPSGYSFGGVAIGNSSSYLTDNIDILEALKLEIGKGANEITLGDLKAKNITVTLKASSPSNKDRLITITFA